MVRVREDMTDWIMAEHGVPDSRLTVIKQVEDYIKSNGEHCAKWLCECNCADHNLITVLGSSLKNGNTLSCGCLRKEHARSNFIDMTGWVMSEHGIPDSRLTVVKRLNDHIEENGRHDVQYLCKCNCKPNQYITARGQDIRNGNTKSCGCLKIDKFIERSKKKNKTDLSGEYGILWTTNTNEEVYFDLEDAEKILQYTWHKGAYGYPMAHIDDKYVTMHKFLGYYRPDHYNQNKLDNRRDNLVVCTMQENRRNTPIRKNNTSGFIGVYLHSKNNKWIAYIDPGDGAQYIGSFINKDDAIKARLKAELKYYGKFAPQRHLFEQYGIKSEEIYE